MRSVVVAPWFVPPIGSLRTRYLRLTSARFRELEAALATHDAAFRLERAACGPVKSSAECHAEAAIWRRFGEPKMAEILEGHGP